ncbi:hypothetical protein E4U61_000444 [Claviceps capensis]|nr:hypothetical protein E4U61_000444 [Claviceps capensis]
MRFYLVFSALSGLALADLNQNDSEARDVLDAFTTWSVNNNEARGEQNAVITREQSVARYGSSLSPETFVNDARSSLAVFDTSCVDGEKGLRFKTTKNSEVDSLLRDLSIRNVASLINLEDVPEKIETCALRR